MTDPFLADADDPTERFQPNLPVRYEPTLPFPAEPTLLTIGDIAVTRSTVIVPQGRFPLKGSTWTVQDSTQKTESIPAWAIVMTILFLCVCLLGLLFLLVKRVRYTGFVSVTVVGDGLYHSVQLPPSPESVSWATHQVNHARSLAAQAPAW